MILAYLILMVGDLFSQETKVDGDTSSLWYVARAIYKLQVHYIYELCISEHACSSFICIGVSSSKG